MRPNLILEIYGSRKVESSRLARLTAATFFKYLALRTGQRNCLEIQRNQKRELIGHSRPRDEMTPRRVLLGQFSPAGILTKM